MIDIKDFTHNQLRALYSTILDSGYTIVPFARYLAEKPFQNFVILRHDVDRKKSNALEIAKIENGLGICSSYYFRYPYTFDPRLITEISAMGHEVGYHYEVLAKTGGDYKKAIHLFKNELRIFREAVEVKTICAHGSPLSPHNNSDLWKTYPFERCGVSGDAQLSVDNPVSFFTDTGRSWDMRNNLRDSVTNAAITPGVRTTPELIAYIMREKPLALYLVVHPERWTSGGFAWDVQYCKDLVFNTGKMLIRRMR